MTVTGLEGSIGMALSDAETVKADNPPCKELSSIVTHLEIAEMWLTKYQNKNK